MCRNDRYFLGIDVGTYESKGVLIDSQCRIVYQTFEKHGLENPRPGFYEHDADAVWSGDVCKISRRVIRESGIGASQIQCVGMSALGCDCVPVDENCNPLCNAILYGIDSRAEEEIAYINDYYKERAQVLFPHPLCSSSVSPKILWIKNHLPQVYAKTAKFLTASSFLTAKMTGQWCIDRYLSGSFAPLYREDGSINEEECGLFCRPDQLATVRFATDIVGSVTAKAALETGLLPGTQVLTGTGDSGAESVSCGVFTPGTIMIQLGSTCFFIYNADRSIDDERVWPGHYIIPGTYCIAAGTNNGGTLTKWYRDQIYFDLLAKEQAGGENAYAAMVDAAASIPAGSQGLITLPYFAGERTPINDPAAKGMIFGLTSGHTRAHMYRSALEGIGYCIAQHFDVLEENHLPITKIMAVGGGTKNAMWLQIIADMLGRDVLVPAVSVGASYGDAIMCALACGCFDSWQALGEKIQIAQVIHPIMENHQHYLKNKPVFAALYENNKNLMHLSL